MRKEKAFIDRAPFYCLLRAFWFHPFSNYKKRNGLNCRFSSCKTVVQDLTRDRSHRQLHLLRKVFKISPWYKTGARSHKSERNVRTLWRNQGLLVSCPWYGWQIYSKWNSYCLSSAFGAKAKAFPLRIKICSYPLKKSGSTRVMSLVWVVPNPAQCLDWEKVFQYSKLKIKLYNWTGEECSVRCPGQTRKYTGWH